MDWKTLPTQIVNNPYSPLIGATMAIAGVILPAIAPIIGRGLVVSGGLVLVIGVLGKIRRMSQ